MVDLASNYSKERGVYIIALKLRDLRQVFNSLDPSPFPERDLDDEIEAYIVDSAREFNMRTPIKLVFYLRDSAQEGAVEMVREDIHNYFAYRADVAAKELRYTLSEGRLALLVGLVFLFVCISLRQLLARAGYSVLLDILEEGLLIGGWVAMWWPLQVFLYEWWPIYRKRRVYRKLSNVPVELRSLDTLA